MAKGMENYMERYHPIVNFIYFAMVLGFGMFLMHPVCVCLSLAGAVCYTLYLFGWQEAKKSFAGLLVIMVLTAAINPAFNHQGVTVITYLPTGNVLTLESILYGIGAAGMLAGVLLWFRCMSKIMTSDKIVYLFGKGFPVLGLLLSMILGFIPKMQKKLREIRLARDIDWQEDISAKETAHGLKAAGRDIAKRLERVKYGIENISILVTWALEDAAQTADSMKSRGYGLIGRTSFTTYRFLKRDVRMSMLLIMEFIYILIGKINGDIYWTYYPGMDGNGWNPYSVSLYFVYMLLMFTPVMVGFCEERKWNKLQSAI